MFKNSGCCTSLHTFSWADEVQNLTWCREASSGSTSCRRLLEGAALLLPFCTCFAPRPGPLLPCLDSCLLLLTPGERQREGATASPGPPLDEDLMWRSETPELSSPGSVLWGLGDFRRFKPGPGDLGVDGLEFFSWKNHKEPEWPRVRAEHTVEERNFKHPTIYIRPSWVFFFKWLKNYGDNLSLNDRD